MKVFVVLDNFTGSAPRVFSTLDKAKLFCETQKKHYFHFYPNDPSFFDDNVEITDKGFADLFIIQSAWVDDYSNYEWE